ncbi:MAG: metallophosphoesterase [Candidatus Micrarchaeia archaeon]
MKLLILSDIHYPFASMADITAIIKKEKPDNLLLLGDNIELEKFSDKKRVYKHFLSRLSKVFPMEKSIIMLGDNDYTYFGGDEVIKILDSFPLMNKGKYFVFKLGNMVFFHGNLEKSTVMEKVGYHFVRHVSKININIAPFILSTIIRFYFGLPRQNYLFIGHLHYLGKIWKNVFCGVLNKKSEIFENSSGYVTVKHRGFDVEEIKLHHL